MKDSDSNSGLVDKPVGNGGVSLSAGAGVVWLLSSVLAMGVAASLMKTLFKCIMPAEFIAGWLLASVNAAVGLMINIRAMRKRHEGFVAWGAGGNVLRSLGVLVIILIVKLSGMMNFEPFITAFLAGYFVFMIAETVRLNVVNFRNMRE